MLTIKEIQHTLSTAGLYVGPIDGIWGRGTQSACDAWYSRRGVVPPVWIVAAGKELGVTETPGPADNARVLEYHTHTSLKATEDSVPWCSAFVNAIMDWTGQPKTNSASARSWLDYGKQLPAFRYGCIVIFRRGGNPNEGHVTFGVWEDNDSIACLGGNQSDKVCVQIHSKDTLIGYRWPKG
jgi:uncharacterized protein (TIGR02594 family)